MFYLLFLLPLLHHVNAQISDKYVHPIFNQPKKSIEGYTKESFDSLLSSFQKDGDGGGWTAQNAWTSIAQWDLQRNSREFYDRVKKAQDNLSANPGHGGDVLKVALVNYYNDDTGWAGLANIVAYEAYGNAEFLERAKGAYAYIEKHGLVTPAAISKGYLEGTKNSDNKIQGSCNGKSMLGGVYWVNGGNPAGDSLNPAAHDSVNAVSTGNFALLGAELCRVTKEMDYCDKTYDNVWWLDRHMLSPEGVLYDNMLGSKCTVTDWRFTCKDYGPSRAELIREYELIVDNQGLYLATYGALGTLTNNATATNIAKKAILKSISPSAPWNNDKGIIKEGGGDVSKTDDGVGFKSILMRYPHKTALTINDPEITKAVREYINIQYYALTQLNSDDPDHPVRYGRNWVGPYAPSTTQAQI